jgi:hypothetical protein
MAKKKKKKTFDFNWLSSYLPALTTTHTSRGSYSRGPGYYEYSIIRPGPPMGYWDSRAKGATSAFYQYTFSGPIEMNLAKSTGQAGLLTASGAYSSFKVGLSIELAVDFAILGAVMTSFDPANKWEGGLDEWGVLGGNQQQSLPNTMSSQEGSTFMWGLKQGHLGILYDLFGGTN